MILYKYSLNIFSLVFLTLKFNIEFYGYKWPLIRDKFSVKKSAIDLS